MRVIVFTGPSLPPSIANAQLEADIRPPVSQGDVLRAVRDDPAIIGIVDGHFHQVPSVWHKEILWAMSHGIHVIGSSSMGALRAAELWQFGMVGIGWVFEAYRDGLLTDDDEVALAHGPTELDFIGLSVPMVNIRRTFDAATEAGVLGADSRAMLLGVAKALHYPERTFERILERAGTVGLDQSETTALEAWLLHGRIDQKREDALDMIRYIRTISEAGLKPKQADYRFEYTDMWDAVVNPIEPGPQTD